MPVEVFFGHSIPLTPFLLFCKSPVTVQPQELKAAQVADTAPALVLLWGHG